MKARYNLKKLGICRASFLFDITAKGKVIELRYESVSQHKNLKLRLIKIEDSRCATGETCFWAGQLLVTLEISDNQNESVEITLVRKRKAEPIFTLDHRFRLFNVEPHPKKGKKVQYSEQVVLIEITKVAK